MYRKISLRIADDRPMWAEHLSNRRRSPMSFPISISAAAIELVLGLLLPVLLPGLGANRVSARALALDLLAEHQPQTARELCLAGEAIGHRLKGMAMIAQSFEPGIADARLEMSLKWATRLARTGHHAEAHLAALQRASHAMGSGAANSGAAAAPSEPAATAPSQPVAPPAACDATPPHCTHAGVTQPNGPQ